MKKNSYIETLDEEAKDPNISTFYNSENLSLNNSHIILDDKTDIEKCDELIYDDKVFGVNIKIKYPWRMGKVFTFLYYKKTPLIVIGPDYPLTLCLFTTINVINALLFYFVFPYLPDILYYMGVTIYLSQTISHILTALMNPGIPSREHYVTNYVKETSINLKRSKENGYKICRICNIIVHDRRNVSHCEECNICCEDHDHHCAWSGKCIGRVNIYPFYIFVFSTFMFILFTFLSTMIFLVTFADRMKARK